MKINILPSLLSAVLLAAASHNSSAAPMINGAAQAGTVTQLPGSAYNYDLFDSPSGDYTPGATSNAVLTNFSITPTAGLSTYTSSTIFAPGADTSVPTDAVPSNAYYSTHGALQTYATFTLVAPPVSPTTPAFNYADFNVYVLYGSQSTFTFDDTGIALAVGSDVTVSPTDVTVSEGTSSGTDGQIVEFNILGGAVGDTFALGAEATVGFNYSDLGGISLESIPPATPEPSTWALMIFGIGALAITARFRSKLTA